MNRLLPVSEVARLLGVNRNFVYKLIKGRGATVLQDWLSQCQDRRFGGVHTKMSKIKEGLLELLDGLEYSLDENGSICFGNEESYREFFRRAEEMAKRYGNKENFD